MKKLIIRAIERYQSHSQATQPKCRFLPTCSQYSKECYMRFNFFHASVLSLIRIIRCNPLTKPRYYPSPPLRLKNKLIITEDTKGVHISFTPTKKITTQEVDYYLVQKYFPKVNQVPNEPIISSNSIYYPLE